MIIIGWHEWLGSAIIVEEPLNCLLWWMFLLRVDDDYRFAKDSIELAECYWTEALTKWKSFMPSARKTWKVNFHGENPNVAVIHYHGIMISWLPLKRAFPCYPWPSPNTSIWIFAALSLEKYVFVFTGKWFCSIGMKSEWK